MWQVDSISLACCANAKGSPGENPRDKIHKSRICVAPHSVTHPLSKSAILPVTFICIDPREIIRITSPLSITIDQPGIIHIPIPTSTHQTSLEKRAAVKLDAIPLLNHREVLEGESPEALRPCYFDFTAPVYNYLS